MCRVRCSNCGYQDGGASDRTDLSRNRDEHSRDGSEAADGEGGASEKGNRQVAYEKSLHEVGATVINRPVAARVLCGKGWSHIPETDDRALNSA